MEQGTSNLVGNPNFHPISSIHLDELEAAGSAYQGGREDSIAELTNRDSRIDRRCNGSSMSGSVVVVFRSLLIHFVPSKIRVIYLYNAPPSTVVELIGSYHPMT